MDLHWHRRDLRVTDNLGLTAAAADDQVRPVFVFDPDVLAYGSSPRVAFMVDALTSLREAYRDRGSDLTILRGDPARRLPELARACDATRVTWNSDYSGLARERDERVARALADAGVETDQFHDAVLHEPGSIRTNEGDLYSVFTYFGRKWHDRPKADPVSPPTEPALAPPPEDPRPVPSLADLDFEDPAAEIPPGSTSAARERLESFCAEPIYDYETARDYPARNGTSRLSVHLKWGTIGIRSVYAATDAARQDAPDEEAEAGVHEFQSQLAWREFYAQVLWGNPETVTENFKDYAAPIEWRNDPDEIAAWKAGETGYPIVDAGMRQLRREAYMHNRVRMIVASFLTKDLLADWRHGYAWFRARLVDHDTANDVGGWQWAASTGTDAQPYFRIFNPMTQGERYDPDAEYVREYVPELDGVPTDAIHGWHELDPGERETLAPEYPAPIVDHSDRRELALERFERARGE
jgi:deoxyribodipyrimidine photo-lyase